MPNWCTNRVTIEGTKEQIERIEKEWFKTVHTEEVLNLLELVPLNEEHTWDYDKAIETWGTKWEPTVLSRTTSPHDTLHMYLDSAWAPPLEALRSLSLRYGVAIEIEYWEEGVGFHGNARISEGNIEDSCGELAYTDEDGEPLTYNEDGEFITQDGELYEGATIPTHFDS